MDTLSGCKVGASKILSCDCINKPFNGEVLMTIMAALAQQESESFLANVLTDGKRRIYSARYALSGLVVCGTAEISTEESNGITEVKNQRCGDASAEWKRKRAELTARHERYGRKICMPPLLQRSMMHGQGGIRSYLP